MQHRDKLRPRRRRTACLLYRCNNFISIYGRFYETKDVRYNKGLNFRLFRKTYVRQSYRIYARLKRQGSLPRSLIQFQLTFSKQNLDAMNNNRNNHLLATSSSMASLNYQTQSKRLLENTFTLVSCKAIDTIFQACGCKFTTAFRQISAIAADESKIDFGNLVPNNIKVFIKSDRPKKHVEVSDENLLKEVGEIPELNMKVAASTQEQKQKLYKYEASLVRIPHGRVHMLCTYADENEEMVHWMLLPLR